MTFAGSPDPGTETTTGPSPAHEVRGWFTDALLITQRNIKQFLRTPQLIMYSVIQPVVFILLFAYVFGGAIDVPGNDYLQFLLPGIFVQMVLFGAVGGAAVGTAEDKQRGITDRFRSLPMTRTSVPLGRAFAELARSLIAIVLMVVIAVLVGFRFEGALVMIVAGFLLLLFFGFAFSWLAAAIGMAAPNAEAAQGLGTIWLFPFTFVSSAFVPTESMPGWLRVYADHSPMTVAVDTLRAWFHGQPADGSFIACLAWSVGIIAVFLPYTVYRYSRLSS